MTTQFPLLLPLAAMVLLALYAYRSIAPRESWLPMHWTFTGRITWRAPRPIALALIPALAIAASIILPLVGKIGERETVMMAWLFLGCQSLHVWLIHRSCR
jgi:hypothetical protein